MQDGQTLGGIVTSLSIAQSGSTSQDHLDTIRTVLKTQVSDILRLNITQLSALPPDTIYDQILNAPPLLQQCFHVFRSQPDLFKRVVVRQDKKPISTDQDLLWCGRTIADVVTLVVRASAKRYFRATLPAAPKPAPVLRPGIGLLHQAAIRLRLKQPPPPPKAVKAPLGQADRLYRAFHENLRFEWQVPLIPHYTPLEASTVTRLGSRILALREPGQLQILAAEGLTPDGRLPLMLDNAKRLRGPDGGIDANALSEAFLKMDLEVVFPDLVDSGAKRAVAQISSMDIRIVQQLMPALENDLRGVTIFLFACFSRLGEKAFRQAFGPCGAMWAVQKLAKHLETCRPWPRSLPGMKQASERALAFAIDLDSGLPAKDKLRSADPGPVPSASAKPAAAAPARPGRAPAVINSAPSRR